MKHNRWKAVLGAFLAAALMLTGCGTLSELLGMEFEADKYVKGILDCTYKGEYADYMATTEATEDDCVSSYESGLEVEAGYFASYIGFSDYFNSEEMDPQLKTDLVDFYREVYQHASYQVKDAVKTDSGYNVEVTIQPIDIFTPALTELDTYITEVENGLNAGLYDEVSDADFYKGYAQGALDICEKYVDQITLLDDVTLVLLVSEDADGYYAISDNDFANVDAQIIYYP